MNIKTLFQILISTVIATFTAEAYAVDNYLNQLSSPQNIVQNVATSTTSSSVGIDLIDRAKEVLSKEIRVGINDGGECLADDFIFRAAVVGPIGKTAYLEALGSFNLDDSFEIDENMFGFTVDTFQTNRVWWITRSTAKHVKKFNGAEPTGKILTFPPQSFHMDFNEDGLVKEIGFYTVDRAQGNTGGLGGAFGYFYGVGKPLPIPECQPYKASKRFRLFSFIGNVASKLNKKKD